MQRVSRRRGSTQQFILIGLFLYLTFIGGTFITDQRLYPRIFHHIFMTLLLGGWLIYLIAKRQPLPRSPLDVPYLLFFSAAVLATLFANDVRISLEFLWVIFTHILLFYFLLYLMRQFKPRTLLEPLYFTASVVCVIGVAEWLSWYTGLPLLPIFEQGWLPIYGLSQLIPVFLHRLTVPLNVATWLAAYLALLMPIAAAWALASKRQTTKQAVWLWLPVAFFVLYFTYSRGGFLSLAVSIGLLACLFVFRDQLPQERVTRLLRDWRTWLVVIVLFGGALIILSLLFSRVGARSGDSVRFDLWRAGWQVGLANPVLGVGPYGFGDALRPLRNAEITRDHLTTPHNIFLLRWAEMGLVGLLAYGYLVVSVAVIGFQRWRTTNGSDQLRIAGVLAGLAGFAAQNQFDNFTATPMVLPVLILIAFLARPLRPKSVNVYNWLPVPLLGLVVLSAIGWFLSDRAQWFYTQSMDGAQSLEARTQSIERAISLDPSLELYRVQEAQLLAESVTPEDADAIRRALLAYEELFGAGVDNDIILSNYAGLLAEVGRFDEALSVIRLAADRNPSQFRYMFAEAELLESSGNMAAAETAYQLILSQNGGLLQSTYWEQTELRQAVAADFRSNLPLDLARHLEQVSPRCLNAQEESEILLEVCDSYTDVLLTNTASTAELESVIQLDPSEPLAYEALALAELADAEFEQARTNAEVLLFLNSSRGHYILGLIAENQGDSDAAVDHYIRAGPVDAQFTGWSIALYNRPATLTYLPFLDAPTLTGYDVLPWARALQLYNEQGRSEDAQQLVDFVAMLDPYFDIAEFFGKQ